MKLDDLPTPALLLERSRLDRNIATMADRARDLGVGLRPHIKTHKCMEIAERQMAAGAIGLTVSTLAEARACVEAGFDDLTWAVPLAPSRLPEVVELTARVRLGVLVDSHAAVDALAALPGYEAWIKVDCGYHRAGVDPQTDEALELARRLEAGDGSLRGILTHSGQAYDHPGRPALARVAEDERRVMVDLAARMRSAGIEVRSVSVGSTPAMSAARDLTGVDEARPGNYALLDATQVALGSCSVGDCALTVLAEVVSDGAGRHSVVNAGALAMSKDLGPGTTGYGQIYGDYLAGGFLPGGALFELSQEHAEVKASLPVGTRVRIHPNHACLTAAGFGAFWLVDGERVVGRWSMALGW